MKRTASILGAFTLAGALAGVVVTGALGKGQAAIAAGPGPFAFGQSYTTEQVVGSWTPKKGNQPDGGYWVRIDCSQGGSVVYAQFADLPDSISDRVVQSGFTFGPTPSWSGGAADCILTLYGFDPYRSPVFDTLAVSATFGALP